MVTSGAKGGSSPRPTSPKKRLKAESIIENKPIRESQIFIAIPSVWVFLSIPFILLIAFGGINLYLNWEHHYRKISDLFDAEELFEGVDFVNLTLLPGGQNDFHPEFPDYLKIEAMNMKAIVTSCHMLEYTGGENPLEDRPRHVRSASGLIWTHHDQLAVLQDDVNFLALVDMKELDQNYLSHYRSLNFSSISYPHRMKHGGLHSRFSEEIDTIEHRIGDVWSIAVPRVEGSRQFHNLKSRKLDLEAGVYVPDKKLLIAFGSGSAKGRSKIVLWHDSEKHQAHFVDHELLELKDAGTLYRAFREEKRFSGSELNIEGAVLMVDRKGRRVIRLFQRGNGADSEIPAISASCDLVLDDLLEYLKQPLLNPVPKIRKIRQYDLGKLLGVKLSFTDASHMDSSNDRSENIIFLAGAEDSPDSFHDGAVMGSTLGKIRCDALTKQCNGVHVPLTLPDGKLFREKAEGVVFERHDPSRVMIVIDPDDPLIACRICSVQLSGFATSATEPKVPHVAAHSLMR